MDAGLELLYAGHVLFAIAWFGGALFSLLVLAPALAGVSVGAMQEINPRLGMYAKRVMPVAAAGTIVLGVITAIAVGHFRSFADVLQSAYGITALVALVLAIGVHEYGRIVIESRVKAMATAPAAEKPAKLSLLRRAILFEQSGFLAVFACMVLLRFGW